jgi:serine/threonine-protein kinase
MLTGELPFDGDSAISIALKHLQEPVVDPRKLNPNIPDSVVKICLRALEKDPEMRFPNVRAMMQELKMALQGERSSSRAGQRKQTNDVFERIPLSGDDTEETVIAPTRGRGRTVQTNHSEQTAQLTRKVGEQTMARLEQQFRHAPADKDKTIFQKTVIWLENVQAKLPWWQKILFGLITVIVIGALTLGAVNVIFKLLSSDNGGENALGANQPKNDFNCQDYIGKPVSEAEKALSEKGIKFDTRYKGSNDYNIGDLVDCRNEGNKVILFEKAGDANVKGPDFVGLWQTYVENHKNEYEKKYGIKIVVNNHLCSNLNLTEQNFQRGQIIYQYPKPEDVKEGDKVFLYVYVPGNDGCYKLPPYLGGENPS